VDVVINFLSTSNALRIESHAMWVSHWRGRFATCVDAYFVSGFHFRLIGATAKPTSLCCRADACTVPRSKYPTQPTQLAPFQVPTPVDTLGCKAGHSIAACISFKYPDFETTQPRTGGHARTHARLLVVVAKKWVSQHLRIAGINPAVVRQTIFGVSSCIEKQSASHHKCSNDPPAL